MVIICSDIGCFMLALFYLENLMGDIQYKMWFSIRVRGGPSPHLQCFSVHLPFSIFFCWTKIVSSVRKCKILLGYYLQRYRMFYVGTSLLRNLMGDIQYKMWFSIRVREGIPLLFICLLLENWNVRKCKNLA